MNPGNPRAIHEIDATYNGGVRGSVSHHFWLLQLEKWLDEFWMNFGWIDWHSWHEFWVNFGCTVDTVDTNFGVNCVNCAPSSKRSPFAVAMHYQQRQRQQQQQQEQREGIKTITTTNTHTQTAITILCPGASPALRSPSIFLILHISNILILINYYNIYIQNILFK